MSKEPPSAPTASAVGPCPTSIQISRTHRHWKITQHLHTTRPTPWKNMTGRLAFITNLRFVDDIDALAEEEHLELETLVESLDKTYTRYKMEISAEKAKLMTNSANGIHRETKVKGHSSTMEQLFQMMAPNQRFSQELPKPLQLLQR